MRYEKKQFIQQLDFIIFIFHYTIVLHAVSFLQSSSSDQPMFVLCTDYFLCFHTCCPFSYVFYQTKYPLLMNWSWKDEKSEHQNRFPFLFRLAIHTVQKWWLEHCNLYSSDIWGAWLEIRYFIVHVYLWLIYHNIENQIIWMKI